ncbi:AAA family ATPase [Nonomuraea sp. SYSU D8015]|uniref:AAA family ATPase n=1 Tax=Nonomuraea sp. SYSU D8015 TaxID=2593644 RepID=UPI001660E441|nr:AAA family ATPase [Nonomuraea sp. SYSU D8015]
MVRLIGRHRPAAILRGEIERALVSHGSLVLVAGEAGIGKSTLVASAAEEAVRRGARLLGGACWEGEGAPGYWPWVQVVRQLEPGATPQSLAGADAEAFQLYDAVTGLLVAASREQPVVVVLEDLHWADAASLRLLEFVVQHAWFERLLLIGTYRDAEVDGPLSLPLEAKATTLTLTGLDREAVGRLVARTTGLEPDDDLVTEIHQRTGGNPFFVEQTARLWQGGSPLATIPPGVEAAVRRRLSRLGDEVLDVLRMAAVLGREFSEETLSTALAEPVPDTTTGPAAMHETTGPAAVRRQAKDLGTPGGSDGAGRLSVSSEAVGRALDQAVSAKLVTSLGAGRHAFVHDLVRETLYAGLDEAGARARHAAALHALDGALPATRAHHAYLGAAPDAPELLLAAARDAEGRMADEEAVGHYRRALELTPMSEPRRRATIGLDLGTAQHRAGDTAAGARTLDAAIAITRGLDDPGLLALTALKLHEHCYTGRGRWIDFVHEAHRRLVRHDGHPADDAQGRPGGERPPYDAPRPPDSSPPHDAPRPPDSSPPYENTRSHEPARSQRSARPPDMAAQEPGDDEARLLDVTAQAPGEDRARRGVRARQPDDGGVRLDVAALELSAVAAELARRGEDDETLGYSLLARLGAVWGPGSPAERLAITEELAAVARRTGDRQLAMTARTWRVGALLELGDPRCLSEQRAFVADAEESQLALYRHEAAVLKAMFATLAGRFDEADTHIDAAYELGEQPGLGRQDLRRLQRWSAALLRGRFDAADAVLAEMEQEGSPHFPLFNAVTAVQRGDGGETAVRHLAEIMVVGEQYLRWMAPLWLRFQAQAAAVSKDPVLCEHARAALTPYIGQWGVTGTVAVEGPFAYWAAMLDAAQERWDDAVAGFTAACRAADLLGARPWSIQSRARLAEVLQARGGDAAPLIEQVEREAAELGMLVRLPRPGANAFRFDGEVWALTFAGRTVHLPDSKGLADLRILLDRPGVEVSAVELLNPPGGQVVVAARSMGGDDVLDEEARTRYRRRLEELDDEIDRAVELGRDRRAAELDAERQALLDELRAAAGLGGRPRRLGDEAERARKAVTNRIRNTLRQLDQRHPELAAHLRASISTGATCRYQPPPAASGIRWT